MEERKRRWNWLLPTLLVVLRLLPTKTTQLRGQPGEKSCATVAPIPVLTALKKTQTQDTLISNYIFSHQVR